MDNRKTYLLIDADNQSSKISRGLIAFLRAQSRGEVLPYVVGNGHGANVACWVDALKDIAPAAYSRVVPSIRDGADIVIMMLAGKILGDIGDCHAKIVIVSRDGLLLRLGQMIHHMCSHEVPVMIAVGVANAQAVAKASKLPVIIVPTKSNPSFPETMVFTRKKRQPRGKLMKKLLAVIQSRGMQWNKGRCINASFFEDVVSAMRPKIGPDTMLELLGERVSVIERQSGGQRYKLIQRNL